VGSSGANGGWKTQTFSMQTAAVFCRASGATYSALRAWHVVFALGLEESHTLNTLIM
jgi:hypothetical protein